MAAVLTFAIDAASADESCGCSFTVSTPDHTQDLGGSSGTASHDGLMTAADQSPAVDHTHG